MMTSSSPSKAGWSPRRVTKGLPRTARAVITPALPLRAETYSADAVENTSGPNTK